MKLQEASKDTLASGDELNFYDQSIKKCIKVIYFYPKSNHVEGALWLMGLGYYQMGKRNPVGFGEISYKRSRTKFQELIKLFPDTKHKLEAELYIALLDQLIEDYPEAKKAYRVLIKKDIDNKILTQAYLGMVQVYNKLAEYDSTIILLKGFTSPHKDFAPQLYYELGNAYKETKRYNEAIEFFNSTIKEKSKNEEKHIAYLQMGRCYMDMGQYDKARISFEDAARITLDDKSRATALLYLAESYFKLKDNEKGVKSLKDVISVYPKTIYSAKAYLTLGNHYISTDEFKKALEALDEVRNELPGSDEANTALTVFNRVNLYLKYQKLSTEGSSESRAKALFQLAEIATFYFGKYDFGIKTYLDIEHTYPKTPYVAQALFAAGWIYKYKKQNKAEADKIFKKIIDEYATSQYKELADYEIRFEKGYETLYTQAQDEYYNYEKKFEAKDYKEALKCLIKVETGFPFTDLKDKASFNKGILYKDYLMDYENAKKTFRELQSRVGYESFLYELCKAQVESIERLEEMKKKSEEKKPEEKKPEEKKTDEVKPEEKKPEEKKTDEVKPEEKKPEEKKTDEVKPEENKSSETKPEEDKTEEKKPEEKKTDDTKPDENKDEQKDKDSSNSNTEEKGQPPLPQ